MRDNNEISITCKKAAVTCYIAELKALCRRSVSAHVYAEFYFLGGQKMSENYKQSTGVLYHE